MTPPAFGLALPTRFIGHRVVNEGLEHPSFTSLASVKIFDPKFRGGDSGFWDDGETKRPGCYPAFRPTKPPLKAVNKESQQSRACSALYVAITFSRTDLRQMG
jgi:hypothetical protein